VGGSAAVACFPVSAGALAQHGLAGSVTRARDLGTALAELPRTASGKATARALGGRLLFAGRVVEIRRDSRQAVHSVVLEDSDEPAHVARVDFRDEYLGAAVDGEPVAAVPDVVCLLDRDTRRPVGSEQLRAGRHVLALCLPAPPALEREPRFGPRGFGLDPLALT
jgi:DUF917 family protein